ncbi:unnamed protein product, partial [Prorocentrum cordatum]
MIWRQELKNTIKQRLRIKYGSPPAGSNQHRLQILRICLARSAHRIDKLMAMHGLPNGDWNNMKEVEVWVPVGAVVDRDRVSDIVSSALIQVGASCKYTLWPRHRWTKSDEAMDQVLLLEACHGLCSATYPQFASRIVHASRGPAIPSYSTGSENGLGLRMVCVPSSFLCHVSFMFLLCSLHALFRPFS